MPGRGGAPARAPLRPDQADQQARHADEEQSEQSLQTPQELPDERHQLVQQRLFAKQTVWAELCVLTRHSD